MIALMQHASVIRALIIRDLMGRFGRQHLGFVWTVLEPMILTSGVMLVWSLIKEPIVHGVPVLTFVLTGYMPLTLWRHLTNPMVKLLRNNVSLLFHRPLAPVDILFGRIALEYLSLCAALAIVYFVVVSTGLVQPVEDWGLVLEAWVLGGWYFSAQGILIGIWSEIWEPAEKFNQPAQYLALPISGCFFLVDWMPEYAQKLLLLNPTVHVFEMFRAGFLGPGITTHFDPLYLVIWSVLLTLLAGWAMRGVRSKIRFS